MKKLSFPEKESSLNQASRALGFSRNINHWISSLMADIRTGARGAKTPTENIIT